MLLLRVRPKVELAKLRFWVLLQPTRYFGSSRTDGAKCERSEYWMERFDSRIGKSMIARFSNGD